MSCLLFGNRASCYGIHCQALKTVRMPGRGRGAASHSRRAPQKVLSLSPFHLLNWRAYTSPSFVSVLCPLKEQEIIPLEWLRVKALEQYNYISLYLMQRKRHCFKIYIFKKHLVWWFLPAALSRVYINVSGCRNSRVSCQISWVRKRNAKHKVTTPWSSGCDTGKELSELTKNGALWEYAVLFYGQFQAKRQRERLFGLQNRPTGCLGRLKRTGELFRWTAPTQLRLKRTAATPQAIWVLWISAVWAESLRPVLTVTVMWL